MLVSASEFPLGKRGQRPILVPMGRETAKRFSAAIPGAEYGRDGLRLSWDMVPVIQQVLAIPPQPEAGFPTINGQEAYDTFFKSRLRDYQKEMVKFLVMRSFALNGDPCRSGKTPTTLAAAALLGLPKVLILCPNLAKLVWATELVKWMRQDSVLLYGRAADEARTFCVTCNGKGRLTVDTELIHCPDCRAKNGQSLGMRIHRDGEAIEAISKAKYVISNYDILIPQTRHTNVGVRMTDGRLPGWAGVLAAQGFDLIIADEAHLLRGRSKLDRKGESRRDKLVEMARGVERVWALTATPVFGRVADLWALLDVLSDGLFGRPFFDFDVHYASGHKGEYGWENDGAENIDELKSRLDTFMLKRDRKTILPHMPPKTRQVIRLEPSKMNFAKPKGGKGIGGLHEALRITAKLKESAVIENVLAECMEGGKTIVYAYQKDSVRSLAEALAEAGDKGPQGTALKARHFRIWAINGDTPVEQRFKMAEAYREWTGCAVFVATINSVPVAISLNGAQSVHFADLTMSPADLLQAEDRSYETDSKGLAILYYVVEKTVDEHVVDIVLPKMLTLENVMKETAAGDFKAAFKGTIDPDVMAEEIWNRMSAAAL